MQRATLATFIGMVGIFALGAVVVFYILRPDQPPLASESPDRAAPEEEQREAPESPDKFTRYENGTIGVSMVLPDDATTDTPNASVLRVRYIGPDAIPNSEITDGYMITFEQHVDVAATRSLADIVARETNTLTERGLAVGTTSSSTAIGSHTGVAFEHETGLGTEVTTHVVRPTETTAYTVTTFIIDPGARGYQQTVDEILESIAFPST